MRILALAPGYYPHMGGAERTLHELFTRLASRGHEVDLVTPNIGAAAEETAAPGFRVFRVGRSVRSRAAKFLLYQAWQGRKVRALARRGRYDVVLLTYGIYAALLQPWIQRFLRLPVVILEFHLGTGAEISSGDENPRYVFPLLRASYRAADAIIATSRDNWRFVRDVAGREDSIVVPQGTDATALHPGLRRDETRARFARGARHLLVTVSRLSPRKNIVDMVRAVGALRSAGLDIALVIVGEGEDRDRIAAEIGAHGLEERVTLAGFLDEPTVASLRASADAFLSTATYEGFGLSIVESMACGIPVVAYAAGGTDDYLVDGETGYVTRQDFREFADAVGRLLANEATRRRMGERCRELVEKQFNWERYADDHVAILDRVVSRRIRS